MIFLNSGKPGKLARKKEHCNLKQVNAGSMKRIPFKQSKEILARTGKILAKSAKILALKLSQIELCEENVRNYALRQ